MILYFDDLMTFIGVTNLWYSDHRHLMNKYETLVKISDIGIEVICSHVSLLSKLTLDFHKLS